MKQEKEMQVSKETVEKIQELEKAEDKLQTWANSFEQEDAYKGYKALFPLSSKKRKTGIQSTGEYTKGYEYIVSKTIGLQANHDCIARPLSRSYFFDTLIKEPLSTLKVIANNIPTKPKSETFIKLVTKLKELKLSSALDNPPIIKKFKVPVKIYYYVKHYRRGTHHEALMTGLSYEPRNIKLLVKNVHSDLTKEERLDRYDRESYSHEDKTELDYELDVEDILVINTIERIYRPLLEAMVEWKRTAIRLIEHDKKVCAEARKITFKFDLVNQL